MGLGVEE
jgi:hypothetical protein